MKKNLVILLGCLWVMPLQAQPEKLVDTTWAGGTNAYRCKWLADSLIQFYGATTPMKTLGQGKGSRSLKEIK